MTSTIKSASPTIHRKQNSQQQEKRFDVSENPPPLQILCQLANNQQKQ
jgi:hypothetical protein